MEHSGEDTAANTKDCMEKDDRDEMNTDNDQVSCDSAPGSSKKRSGKRKSEALEDSATSTKIPKDEKIRLSDSIFMRTEKKLSVNQNVFEGEIRKGNEIVGSCAIKLAQNHKQIAKEAKILRKFGLHTNIISVIQEGVFTKSFEEHSYIALEKCHEQNLRDYFESNTIYDINIGLDYTKQIIAGMKHIHEKLIIHKDLKPSNILLSLDQKTIKIADFGLSEEIPKPTSMIFSKHQFGTNGFRPPESFGDSFVSLKSDIFSLGVVFYFILSMGQSPFGEDHHLWNYNTKKVVLDFSGLPDENFDAIKHLITHMLIKERRRRPSIWKVADHPCWLAEVEEPEFDYGFQEETNDSGDQVMKTTNETSEDIETGRGVLEILNELGITSRSAMQEIPFSETSIIVFDGRSKHLQHLNTESGNVTQMHGLNDEMKKKTFTTVYLDGFVYVLTARPSNMHRLKFSDPNASWEQIPGLNNDHGSQPVAVAASGLIILAGASGWKFSKSVTTYDPSLKRWGKLKSKQLATSSSANVASQGFIYCIGGGTESGELTNRVERLHIASQSWIEVAPMHETRYKACAIGCSENIFAAGGRDRTDKKSIEKYDPTVNQWTQLSPMRLGRCVFGFECHAIEHFIYAVEPGNKGIEIYDVETDTWNQHQIQAELDIRGSFTLEL